jgi:hypothetical protein
MTNKSISLSERSAWRRRIRYENRKLNDHAERPEPRLLFNNSDTNFH